MSEQGPDIRKSTGGVDATDIQAADWVLARRLTSQWSRADQIALDAWIESALSNRIAYLRLDAAWERAYRLEALNPHDIADVEARPSRWPLILLRIAAVLGVIAILGAAGLYALQPGVKTYATAIGGHELVSFDDGTKIELNTDTVLHARMTTSGRMVWLDKGEAYFEVKHDSAHPFVVLSGNRRITDLGTKFLVRRDSGHFEVAVVQGRVWFDTSGKQTSDQTALLTQGDEAIATANTLAVKKEGEQKLAKQLGWRQGMLVFDRVSLAEAAKEFNRYNRRKIVIADAQAANQMIGGTFPATNVDAFTSAIQLAFGLHVQLRGNDAVISH
jgi:transmembrane sensor